MQREKKALVNYSNAFYPRCVFEAASVRTSNGHSRAYARRFNSRKYDDENNAAPRGRRRYFSRAAALSNREKNDEGFFSDRALLPVVDEAESSVRQRRVGRVLGGGD